METHLYIILKQFSTYPGPYFRCSSIGKIFGRNQLYHLIKEAELSYFTVESSVAAAHAAVQHGERQECLASVLSVDTCRQGLCR